MGAITGPKKLAAVNSARGTERWLGGHKSVNEPPELVTKTRVNPSAPSL